jgi:hypothetical protein
VKSVHDNSLDLGLFQILTIDSPNQTKSGIRQVNWKVQVPMRCLKVILKIKCHVLIITEGGKGGKDILKTRHNKQILQTIVKHA